MNQTFQQILNVHLSYLPLEDMGLVTGDDINSITEELVIKAGYDMEQYADWHMTV